MMMEVSVSLVGFNLLFFVQNDFILLLACVCSRGFFHLNFYVVVIFIDDRCSKPKKNKSCLHRILLNVKTTQRHFKNISCTTLEH